MIVDVYGLSPGVPAKLLDELPPHACPPQVRGEPMPAAVGAEMVLKPLGGGIMQASPPGRLNHQVIDPGPVKPLSPGIQE